MINLRLWHEDDKNTFHNEKQIYFSQCDKNNKLSINELLRLTSDAAVEDYKQRGLTREFLLEHGYYILVSRCAFKFLDFPRENQKVEIITWEESPEPLQLYRGYKIVDSEGKTLINGYSSWLLVDANARRIIPTKKFTLREPFDVHTENDCLRPGKIIIPDNKVFLDEITIRYSDIDGNGHTNNSRYGAFLMDALPKEYQDRNFTDFRINYAKEAMLGQKLRIYAHFADPEKKIFITGETEEGTSFDAELYYR